MFGLLENPSNLYQNDGMKTVQRSTGKYGGGSVMEWACMAVKGTGSLVFIDDGTADRCRMNS